MSSLSLLGRLRSQRGEGDHALVKEPQRTLFWTPPRLTVELVPRPCWGSNVRSLVTPQAWNQLRRQTYRAAHDVCEICGGQGAEWPVECHEVWQYDDAVHVQTLVRLIALCPACHAVKHLGRTELYGDAAAAHGHLATVNGWTGEQTATYLAEVWAVWEARSRADWQLDVTWLAQVGITVRRPR
jgi:hypothetical protein